MITGLLSAGLLILLAAGVFGLARSEGKHRRNRRTVNADWARARLQAMCEPSLTLSPTARPVFSKLGGAPEKPASTPWPRDGDRPLIFLGQIDLSEARDADGPAWLPLKGRLFAFYDPNGHGASDVVRLLYSLDPPAQLQPSHDVAPGFREQRMALRRVVSAPDLAWLGVAHHHLQDDDPAAWKSLETLATPPLDDDPQHRIGGYPNAIQDAQSALACEHAFRGLPPPDGQTELTPALKCAADEWRLLLQIDSDPGLKMNFGDGGRLYTFIRKADAEAADFTRTVAMWQTY